VETAGVVLFVDISGFSALTERLTQEKGGAGVDQMARILDEKFTRIIARIEDAGGEVATTAGDAVFAWWEARSEGARAQATRRAVACTQAIAAELVAPIEGITVRVRQSIAAGPLLAVRLGEDPPAALLDGPPIDELAELDPRPGGPAVLTRGAARALDAFTPRALVYDGVRGVLWAAGDAAVVALDPATGAEKGRWAWSVGAPEALALESGGLRVFGPTSSQLAQFGF
jgi:hypothetical protein